MKKDRKSFAKQNKGSALIAVLIILTFVSVIAVIITKITITNIEMNEVQSSTRKNFYNTEDIMDVMKSGLSEISAVAVKESYADVLENYSLYTSEGKKLKEQFKKEYLEKIEEKFWDSSVAKKTSTEENNPEQKLYTTANYKTDIIKDCISENISDTKRECFKTDDSEAKYELDYEKGVFILKNIKVVQEESQGYATEIKTDIVFEAPDLVFDKKFQTAEFMKYALIADDMINASANSINVSGNVYAGVDGIVSLEAGSSAVFKGDTIVTRGDIVSGNSASLTIKSTNTSDAAGVWAQNIKTTGEGAKLSVSGNSYVADDLSLEGKNGSVTLSGAYYGYNFQKNYGEKETGKTNDAAYSSAIIINGKNSTLDMKSLNTLMLSGRTFISRAANSQNSDIAMGESLAVRTNQLAYYVSASYLDEKSDDQAKKFTYDGLKKYKSAINVDDIEEYLDTEKQVVPYYYVVSGAVDTGEPLVNYYLNFKTEEKANEFFAKYYKANQSTVNANASVYASKDALVIDENKILTLGGNILYREKSDSQLKQKEALSIGTTDWDKDGAWFTKAAECAKKYKALQLGLTTTHDGVTDANVRITKDNNANEDEDKTQNSLFSYIVNESKIKETVDANGNSERVCLIQDENASNSLYHKVTVLADNAGRSAYMVPSEYNEGIIIATGDVTVSGSFTGLILSGGKINFAAGANVTADEVLVSEQFQDALKNDVFKDVINEDTYSDLSSLGGVDITDYISYENWKKNEE